MGMEKLPVRRGRARDEAGRAIQRKAQRQIAAVKSVGPFAASDLEIHRHAKSLSVSEEALLITGLDAELMARVMEPEPVPP